MRLPAFAWLTTQGWNGIMQTRVLVVRQTTKRARIRAITRTKLAGRNRWLEPGQEASVPDSAVRFDLAELPTSIDPRLVACPAGHGEPCEPIAFGDGQFARCPKCGDDSFPVIQDPTERTPR